MNIISPAHILPTRTKLGLFLLILTFIIIALPLVDDPDFGWHLKSGQIYSETRRIPQSDPFSYTMADYSWVNHEYAADALYYLLYRVGGDNTFLLSLFFLSVGIITFLVVFPRTFFTTLAADERIFAGLIGLIISRQWFGIRSQVFDWLGFLLVIFIWNRFRRTKSRRQLLWYLPLFFLWTNIHGGFFIGFALLGFFICFDTFKTLHWPHICQWYAREKTNLFFAIGILLLSLLSTLINPYGIHLHQDILQTLGNKTMMSAIIEWKPFAITSPLFLPFTIYFLSLILLLMLVKREKQFTLGNALLVIIFFILAFSSLRFIPFFVLVSLPIFFAVLPERIFFLPMLLCILIPGFIITTLQPHSSDTQNTTFSSVSTSAPPLSAPRPNDFFYNQNPVQALAFLATHPIRGNMFNDYAWGGALIWSFPQYKVFIDGRMPYWNLNGRNIFEDYLAIDRVSQGWDKKIESYRIDWFLIKKSTAIGAVLETLPNQWEKKYDDGFAVIFVRK